MASSAKPLKDKIGSSPRLLPRPTAASAARAARNATNRNLTQAPSARQSPSRGSTSPAPSKARNTQRNTSKTDIRITRGPENEVTMPYDNDNQVPLAVDSFVILDNSPVVPAADTDQITGITETHLQEINENDVFVADSQGMNETQQGFESPSRTAESPRSRPLTPTPNSRPETPSYLSSSRPQTPRLPSRPSTPRPASRPTTPRLAGRPTTPSPASRPTTPRPASRPTTPRVSSRPTTPNPQLRRPGTPSSRPNTPRPLSPTLDKTASSVGLVDDVKSAFIIKQKQFHHMKKELDIKQQAVLEMFETLQGLRERMTREGVSGCVEGNIQDLMVFNVADWTAEEVAQLCRDAAPTAPDGAVEVAIAPIDECALAELDAKVLGVPHRFTQLCLEAFAARQELIDWVKGLIQNNVIKDESGDGECLERISRYNDQGLQLCNALREIKERADNAVNTVTQLSKRACRERGTLISVGESLVREIARLRQDIEARSATINQMRSIRAENETAKALEETLSSLQQEKAAYSHNKDKLTTTESQLRQARGRITKMDRQLREAEASIASLTSTVKTLEDQSRQKEVQLEARARKLKENLKTGEVASGHLAQQRDILQSQINQLQEQIDNMTLNHKSAIQDLTNQLKESKTAYEVQCRETEEEKYQKHVAQKSLTESQNIIEDLKTQITELENSRPNPDLPTEREMDLWAELQATKDTLRITEDEVVASKREKVKFLETLTKITESENKVGIQQKLAAELLNKEETLGKMQIQMRDLMKNIRLNEQKVIQYEQYVRDLQAHNRSVANCQESPNGISYQDLQQEIMNLKMNLLEASHHNEQLAEKLLQKEQQIEQQEKTSRSQARVIKVREELINMLKNKETEQCRELTALQQDLEHRMKVVDEVNKQIAAKAEEIQELFSTLENKQQQIHRLEKIVLALEEQQRRAQAQRTRHEEKIAALEHELAAGGNRKERKFLFF